MNYEVGSRANIARSRQAMQTTRMKRERDVCVEGGGAHNVK